MMRRSGFACFAWLALVSACSQPGASAMGKVATMSALRVARLRVDPQQALSTVVFGSCLDPSRPHPILDDVVAAQPDLVVMLGDNVYADAGTEADLERAYASLAESPGFQRMSAAAPILAVWDDHDYGRNDVGKEFELKDASKRIMLDFFGEPASSPRRARAGNYDAVVVGPQGQRVQLLLLDTRWFRDPLRAGGSTRRYVPHDDVGPTVLGEAQWIWLETQLRTPADLRFLVTGIQLEADEHPFESWGLFPAERRRMFDLIASTEAGGVIVVSGDRHRGELACAFDAAVGYPLLELTASSFNRPNHNLEDNRFRRPGSPLVGEENFGIATIDWSARTVTLGLRGIGGVVHLMSEVSLDALQPGRGRTGVADCHGLTER
ncbi:MAG: alkaline phosphatase family protein [Nannocystaceae bacterium]|nr:alkaline phosphatase family protein [Nannocystaceae bacterium]